MFLPTYLPNFFVLLQETKKKNSRPKRKSNLPYDDGLCHGFYVWCVDISPHAGKIQLWDRVLRYAHVVILKVREIINKHISLGWCYFSST